MLGCTQCRVTRPILSMNRLLGMAECRPQPWSSLAKHSHFFIFNNNLHSKSWDTFCALQFFFQFIVGSPSTLSKVSKLQSKLQVTKDEGREADAWSGRKRDLALMCSPVGSRSFPRPIARHRRSRAPTIRKRLTVVQLHSGKKSRLTLNGHAKCKVEQI